MHIVSRSITRQERGTYNDSPATIKNRAVTGRGYSGEGMGTCTLRVSKNASASHERGAQITRGEVWYGGRERQSIEVRSDEAEELFIGRAVRMTAHEPGLGARDGARTPCDCDR